MKTETYILPAYYASALINNDYSGLEDSDILELEHWINKQHEKGKMFYCINADIENCYFKYRNDIHNLGCEVCKFTFDVSDTN